MVEPSFSQLNIHSRYFPVYYLKSLTNEIRFNSQKNTQGGQITLSDIKMKRFVKGSEVYFYKSSYKQMNWEEAHIRTIGSRCSGVKNLDSIITKLAYKSKIPTAENKK